jgi:hypothetical protein
MRPDHYKIEMLSEEQVEKLWPQMEPLFKQACDSNELSRTDLSPEIIYDLAIDGTIVIFAFYEAGRVATVLAIQFTDTYGLRGADLIAMAGRNLMVFKKLFWEYILDWLRANNIKHVDAYANERIAEIYKTKFGFEKSCQFVRMTL